MNKTDQTNIKTTADEDNARVSGLHYTAPKLVEIMMSHIIKRGINVGPESTNTLNGS